MATIVWGHGTRDRGEEKTFVPQGSTVKWYSEVDENLMTANGFLAISGGSFSAPVESFGPGDGVTVEVYNYGVFEDLVKRDYVAILNDEKNELLFIGAEIKEGHLCNDLEGCKNAGEHKCDGVLGIVGANKEIAIMVCRGLPGSSTGTKQFGGDADDPLADFGDQLQEFVNGLWQNIFSNPEEAEKGFDSLPTASLAIIGKSYGFVDGWKAVRWAADAGRNGDIPSMWDQMRGATADDTTKALLGIPRYKEGIIAGAKANPDAFFKRLDAGSGPLDAQIRTIAELDTVRQERQKALEAARDHVDAQRRDGDWHPTDKDYEGVISTNGANVKASAGGNRLKVLAGGVLVLIGSGHDAKHTTYVQRQADLEDGWVTVKKGGAFSKGTLTVTGISAKQGVVKSQIGEFSDKSVVFE